MNKHASDRLNISVVTVKAHRGKVMRKMAARSLAQLVDMANELNIEYPALPFPKMRFTINSRARTVSDGRRGAATVACG